MNESSDSILNKKRELLTQKENELLHEIESQTSALNVALNKSIKKTLFVGGGLVAGYAIYKLLSGNEKKAKSGNEKKAKVVNSVAKKNNLNLRVFRPLLSLILEKGLTILVDSLKSKTEK